MTAVHSTPTTNAQELSIAISKARVIPGSPARVTFVLQNRCDCDFEVVSSAFEIKRTNIGVTTRAAESWLGLRRHGRGDARDAAAGAQRAMDDV